MAGGASSGSVGTERQGLVSGSSFTKPSTEASEFTGEHGGRTITPVSGKSYVTGEEGAKITQGKNLQERELAVLPTHQQLEMDTLEEDDPSDDEANEWINKIQQRQKEDQVKHSSGHIESSVSPSPSERKAAKHESPPNLSQNSQSGSATDGNPLKAAVSVSGRPDIDEQENDDLQNQIKPKKGFLEKYGKELGVSLGGGALVLVGAGAAILFPPAGLLVYSCGVMMLSMGLSKMLFALEDEPDPLPQPDEKKTKNKNGEETEPSAESGPDRGQFVAVRKNILDGLKNAGIEPPVDETGRLDREKLKKLQEEQQVVQRQMREQMLQLPGGKRLLEQLEQEAENGKSVVDLVTAAVAEACEGDESVSSDELMRALNPVLEVAEQTELLTGDMADEERQAKIRSVLPQFEQKLPEMDKQVLARMIQSTELALQLPATKGTRVLLTTVAEMLANEKARREQSGAALSVPPPPPPALPANKALSSRNASIKSEGKQSVLSPGREPISSGQAIGTEGVNQKLSNSRVFLRIFNLELNRAFARVAGQHKLTDADKQSLISLASDLEKQTQNKLTEQELMQKLLAQSGDRLKPLMDAVLAQRAEAIAGLSSVSDKSGKKKTDI